MYCGPAPNVKYNNKEFVGKKFNSLVVKDIKHQKQGKYWYWMWLCKCDCGNEKYIRAEYVIRGHTKTCGCGKCGGSPTHGETKSRLHHIWCSMRQRCIPDTKVPSYQRYGPRGIIVCDEWNDYVTFAAWAKANGYDDTKSIERIDNDGNYCPENCKWIERGKQARNRCTTKYVEYQGRRMSLAEASEIAGLSYKQVHARITRLGWPVEEALSVPIGQFGRGMKAIKARTKHELSLK